MASLTVQVGASTDDARNINGATSKQTTPATMHLGKFNTTDKYWNGWIFPNVTIPQGATINSAYLDLYSSAASSGTSVPCIFYGIAEDNAATFNTTTVYPEGKPRTTATATKTFTVSNWSTTGFGKETVDVTSIVQEIINRGGWSSGNRLGIVGYDNGASNTTYIAHNTYDSNSTRGAKLIIDYSTDTTTTQTVDGKARITATTTKTITGKARVTATASQTITGKARITISTSQTVNGVARIQKSVSQTVTGKGNILATTSRTITGVARIAIKTENLTENFDDDTFDTVKWERTNDTQIVEDNGQLEMTTLLAGNYISLDSHGNPAPIPLSLIGSSIFIEVKDAGNQDLESLEVYPITLALDPSNNVGISIIGNQIQATKRVAASNSSVGSAVGYNPATHKFFRIRESGGTVYFDHSPDADSWTNFASVANPFDLTNLQFEVSIGTWQEEETTTVIFDNINVVPETEATQQTIDGKARITATTTKTVTGKGRIQKTASQTINGKAFITASVQQHITGVARIVGDSSDVESQVNSSNNDVRNISGNGTYNATVTTQHLGKFSTTDYWNGWLFSGVSIPQGAIIDTANLNLFSAQTTAGSQAKAIFYGVAEDNATAFANNTGNKPEGKARTTASSAKNFNNSSWNATAGFDIEPIDVSSIVQEIVNRAGWASGNNLAIVGHDNGSANNNYIGFSTYDRDPARGAKLEVSYHLAGGSQQTITGKARITGTTQKTITGKAQIAGVEGTWNSLIMGWIYPAQNDAANDYKDGRKIHFLKPEYFTLSRTGHKGSLYRVDLATSGEANTYSPENVAEIKAYSDYQFTTVSATTADMQTFLGNTSARNAGITTLVNFCIDSGFTGIELDWEGYGNWTLANTNAFKLFCTDLGNALHAVGKKLMIDLPPIGNSTMQGYYPYLKYEDFNSLPVDYLVVMAYDYQWDYGGGASVQPIAWMESICDWAKSKITNWEEKLVIGMPNYGYHATIDQYNVVIDTKLQSSARAGYNTATRNADYEMNWTQSGVANFYQDTIGLNAKRTAIEAKGIKLISVWHLGDNDWFTGTEPTLGEVTTTRIIDGKASILGSTSRNILGKASIAKTVNTQITGVARIIKGTERTIDGKARIQLNTQRTITGIARIQTSGFTVGSQTITGKANIRNNTQRTVTGRASIKKATQKNIVGKARIIAPQDTEFKIINNIILDPVRETAITPIYDALAGITFNPFKADDGGLGYLQLGDRITLKDRNNEEFEGIVLKMEVNVNTGIAEKIGADIPEKTSTPYDRAGIIGQQIRNTEIKVDKQNGVIELINQNITENYYTKEETQAQITLTTQEIVSSVQSIASIAQSALDTSNTTADQMTVVQASITELVQTATELALKVERAGGVNLLKNSVGLKGDLREWQVFDSEGLVADERNNATIDQSSIVAANSESGSALVIADQFITQSFPTIVGKQYTLYLRFNKVGVCTITITGVGEIALTIPDYVDGSYAIFKYQFTATDTVTNLRFENDALESATLTDIIVKIGDASGWDQAPNEVYGKGFKFDKNGLEVSDPNSKFRVVLDNEKLTVYDDSSGTPKIAMQVAKDAGKVTKLTAQDEFVIRRYENDASSTRMIPVEDGLFIVIND